MSSLEPEAPIIKFLADVRREPDLSPSARFLVHLMALDYRDPNAEVFEVQYPMVQSDMSTDRRGVQKACYELCRAGRLTWATDGHRLIGKLNTKCRGHQRQFANPTAWAGNVVPMRRGAI